MRISDWSSDVCSSDLGFIYAYDGAGNLLASAAEGWIPNTWHSFSVTIKIHETEGLVTLRRDGEPIINVTNINTVNGSHTTIDRVRYQAPNVEFDRSEEHTSELQSLMRISYAVFCLKKKKKKTYYKN